MNEKERQIQKILNESAWKELFKMKTTAFFAVIKKIEEYLHKKIIVTRDINWLLMPGFNILINSILHELVKLPNPTYSNSLLEILVIFINKTNIMNSFFQTIMAKTK